MICQSLLTKPCPSLHAQACTPTPALTLRRRCGRRGSHGRFPPTAHAVQAETQLEASRPQVLPLVLWLVLPCTSSDSMCSPEFELLAQDELVLVEHSTEAGDAVQIVYRNGGLVDANALESLCDKVLQTFVQSGYGAYILLSLRILRRICSHAACEMQVGWPRRPLTKVQTALANSFLTSGLYLRHPSKENSQKSDQLIGLARATSDHVFNATIWDVLVDPEYQVSLCTVTLHNSGYTVQCWRPVKCEAC